jgi:ElaB/YqjD/DUF883 family membrane-anchored ribosome-binding protein
MNSDSSSSGRARPEKDPSEIEAEIEQTRTEISESLNAIGEKLSPEQLKEDAKQIFDEAKEAVVDKLRDAKDSALQAANERLQDVRERARYAGEVTYGYARENAIPLGLIGLGIGWLLVSGRRRRNGGYRIRQYDRQAFGNRDIDYGEDFDATDWADNSATRGTDPSPFKRSMEETKERAAEVADRAKNGLNKGVRRARERARELGQRANELSHQAREQFDRAESSALDFANENPLAVGAAALAVGVGVGLLLPSTRREDEFLGEARDRLIGEVRGSVDGMERAVKQTAHEMKGVLREAPRT